MALQLNIFLLLFGGLQGVLLTLFLARKKMWKPGHVFLLLYFAVLLLQIVLKVMSKGWLMHHWPLLYALSYQLPFLYGPLLYLFVRGVAGQPPLRAVHLLHLLPFAAAGLLAALGPYSTVADTLLENIFAGERRLMLQLASIALYHYFAFKTLPRSSAGWVRQFTMVSCAGSAVVALTIYFMYVYYPALNWMRMGFLSLTGLIYWVSYKALTQPGMFVEWQPQGGVLTGLAPRLQVHRPAKKYSNSTLSAGEAARIATALEQAMTAGRLYLEAGLTIDRLAASVGSNKHHLSQVLNEKIGLPFYDYVNTFRVNAAKLALSDPARAGHKIAAIAYDSGFNSLSVFNEVFKKCTGQTPSAYRKLPATQKVSSF